MSFQNGMAQAHWELHAWIVMLLIPILILLFKGINRHYTQAATEMAAQTPLDARPGARELVLQHGIVRVEGAQLQVPAMPKTTSTESLASGMAWTDPHNGATLSST